MLRTRLKRAVQRHLSDAIVYSQEAMRFSNKHDCFRDYAEFVNVYYDAFKELTIQKDSKREYQLAQRLH